VKRLFGSALKTLGFLTILISIPISILFGGWAIFLVLYIIGVGLLLYIVDFVTNYLIKGRKVFWRVQFTLATTYLLLCIWTYMEWQKHNAIIFPKGFHGQAGIVFGVERYPELPKTRFWKRTIQIPENGIIMTSTREEEMVNRIQVSFEDNSPVDYDQFDWDANFEIDCITSHSKIKSWLFKIDTVQNSIVKSTMTELCDKIAVNQAVSFYKTENSIIWSDTRGKYLWLQDKELNSLPNGMDKLDIYKAILTGNDFTEVPSQILEIASLQDLIFANNPISNFPCNLQKLKRLKGISFASTKIKEIHCDLSRLDSLKDLDMARNNLTEFPEQIKTLPNLTWLSLNDNELKDIAFIDNRLSKLERLYLHSNEIKSISTEIKYLLSLKELLLFDNKIDSIPDYFSSLTNLENLEIWDNPIKYITPEIKKLQKLRQMRIDDDNLTIQDKDNLKKWLPNCTINFQTRAGK
jgi:hypothetical protein